MLLFLLLPLFLSISMTYLLFFLLLSSPPSSSLLLSYNLLLIHCPRLRILCGHYVEESQVC